MWPVTDRMETRRQGTTGQVVVSPLSRMMNRGMQFALDVIVLSAAFVLAYLLRFEFVLSGEQLRSLTIQWPLVLLVQFSALFVSGVYAFIWRYVGLAELRAFLKAAFWSGLILVFLRLALPDVLQHWRIPLSVILMDSVLAFGGIVGVRVLRRAVYERYERRRRAVGAGEVERKPVLLVGAGRAGVLAAKEIRGRGDMNLEILGFVDDDPEKQGAVIQGVRVLGRSRDLPRLAEELQPDHVIITIAQASRRQLRRIMAICEKAGLKARIIPGLYEILDGRVGISAIRDVEIEDLLGREPVRLDEDSIARFIKGKTVMVTGAGGSIGSEMARQVARFGPSTLLLLERAEFALFEIDRELRRHRPDLAVVALVGDVCDEPRVRQIMERYRPAVVFHAAAHKHVPMMELNPIEAVKNNVLGTWTAGVAAAEAGAEAFVLISTDKAVRPSSVMGASKRVAELVVRELDRRFSTRFIIVRFGNVMGSAGSVIPIFREQIRRGGPVTVTHPDMVRYFLTIPEASQLVLQAGAMGDGGELFILDMGEPVRIFDLARDMITLSGLKPFEDIDIVFTGIRPGEKLFEELQTAGEDIEKTRHPKVFIGRINGYPSETIDMALDRIRVLALDGDDRAVRAFLEELLPEARLRVG